MLLHQHCMCAHCIALQLANPSTQSKFVLLRRVGNRFPIASCASCAVLASCPCIASCAVLVCSDVFERVAGTVGDVSLVDITN